jgi:signal transduction protein with GAF and PtsI domain
VYRKTKQGFAQRPLRRSPMMKEDKTIEYFRSFFDVSQAIFSSLSLKDILKILVKKTVSALGAKAGSLRLVNEKTNRLELVASQKLSKKYLNKGSLSSDQSIPEVLEGKVVVIKNAFNDPRIQYMTAKKEEGIDTVLSVPIVAKDKVIGVLRLYSGEPRDFSDEEIEFVSALGEMGGLAIVNAKIYEDEGIKLSSLLNKVGIELPEEPRKRPKQRLKSFPVEPVDPSKSLEYFRVLHEITGAILSTLDSRQVIDLVIEKVVAIMKVNACSLRLVNETTRELELIASRGLSERYLKKGPIHMDKSIRETLEGAPVLIRDATTDPRIEYLPEKAQEGIVSILSLPIIATKRVIGIVRLYSHEMRQYSRNEVAFLSALAEIAGAAIINARMYEKTKYDLSFWKTSLEYLDIKGD